MAQINVVTEVDLEELALSLAWQTDRKDLIKFIMTIDESVCDYDFTKKLAKKLTKLYKAEDKVNPQ